MHRLVSSTLALLLGVMALGCDEPASTRVWHEQEGHRWAALVPKGGEPGFGVHTLPFVNEVTEAQTMRNRHYLNGSGVAVGDVNGDDRPDLYFARLDGPNVLYLNQGGFRFAEATNLGDAALADAFSTGAALADVDGDGDLDLLVAVLEGPNRLLLNDGGGGFTVPPLGHGFDDARGSMSLALADVDRDGDLDVYVANYKNRSARDIYSPDERHIDRVLLRDLEGRWTIAPAFQQHYRAHQLDADRALRLEVGEPDVLLLNRGDGTFEAVSWTDGHFLDEEGRPLTEAPREWALAARFADWNADGHPDLYVANDFDSPDHVWLNQGDGTFRALSTDALRSTSASTMSIAVADADRDGDLDLFLADMLSRDPVMRRRQITTMPMTLPGVGGVDERPQYMRNSFLLQREDGTFADATHFAGLEASEWTWSSQFLDVDLDGWPDLLVTNGHRHDVQDLDTEARIARLASKATGSDDFRKIILLYPELERKNLAFRNVGGGRFEAADWGFAPEADVSHGMAAGDLDGDGDLDLVVNRLGRPVLVLESRSDAPRVAVRLKGRSNTAGVGALVTLDGGAVPSQSEEVTAGGAYLSGGEALASFAAGDGTDMTITVRWPSGAASRVENVQPNRLYEIEEPPPPTTAQTP